jgi:hypothetical protein
MAMFWWGVVTGFFIGGFLGIVLIACIVVGSRSDKVLNGDEKYGTHVR